MQRLDNFKFYIYQEIDCLNTLFKHRIHSSIVTSSGEVFNQHSRAFQHILRWKGAKKVPSIAKKRLIRKKFKRHLPSFNQKLASTQTYGTAFLDRIGKVQNSKYENDLLKIIDCFINCHGFLIRDNVKFSIQNLNLFDNPSIFSQMLTKKSKIFKKKKKIYRS